LNISLCLFAAVSGFAGSVDAAETNELADPDIETKVNANLELIGQCIKKSNL
jgi:hypothetical protein